MEPDDLLTEIVAMTEQEILDTTVGPIRLRKIAEIPNDPNDLPDDEWMRAIDELLPHLPDFKGCY